jgi:ribosome-binding protein aMBF1 (putative translation factor)
LTDLKYAETSEGQTGVSRANLETRRSNKFVKHKFSVVRTQLTEKQRHSRARDKAALARLVDKLVATHIRTLRIDKGLTQQHLADKVGVASQQIHKYESGISRITAGRLLQLAEALDFPIDEFFDLHRVATRADAGKAQRAQK